MPLLQTIRFPDCYDVIYCTGWRAYLHGFRLKKCLGLSARLCLGIYHPREFCLRGEGVYQRWILDYLRHMPQENLFFHDSKYAEEHGSFIGADFSSASLVPFGIDLNRFQCVERKPDRHKMKNKRKIRVRPS